MGLLDSENEGIKHRATKDVIEFTVKSMELEDLERRIEILEMKIQQPSGKHR